MTTSKSIDRGYRFPADVIEQAVWLSIRFPQPQDGRGPAGSARDRRQLVACEEFDFRSNLGVF